MKREGQNETITKEQADLWQLRCLQSIYQWFDGRAIPMEENYEALSSLVRGQ